MKQLIITLVMCLSMSMAYTQCEGDIPSAMLSINHKGITAEFGHIAQITKVGFIFGATVYQYQEARTNYVYDPELGINKEVKTGEYSNLITGDLHMYATYKLIHKDYKYSLHILAGSVFSLEDGLYASAGAEVRVPANTVAFFGRVLYPGDYRAGIILRL